VENYIPKEFIMNFDQFEQECLDENSLVMPIKEFNDQYEKNERLKTPTKT